MILWLIRTLRIDTTASMTLWLTSCWNGLRLCPDWTHQRTSPSAPYILGVWEILSQMEILSKEFCHSSIIQSNMLLISVPQLQTVGLFSLMFIFLIPGVTSTSLVRSVPLQLSRGNSVLSSSSPRGRQLRWQLRSPLINSSSMDGGSLSNGEGKNLIQRSKLSTWSSHHWCIPPDNNCV